MIKQPVITAGFNRIWLNKLRKFYLRNHPDFEPDMVRYFNQCAPFQNGAVQWNYTNIISLGPEIKEEVIIPVLNHEIMHYILSTLFDDEVGHSLDNLGNSYHHLNDDGIGLKV